MHSCDINAMYSHYCNTGSFNIGARMGEAPTTPTVQPIEGLDFSVVPDLQTHLNNMISLESSYDALPESTRNYFGGLENMMELACTPNWEGEFEKSGIYVSKKLRALMESIQSSEVAATVAPSESTPA